MRKNTRLAIYFSPKRIKDITQLIEAMKALYVILKHLSPIKRRMKKSDPFCLVQSVEIRGGLMNGAQHLEDLSGIGVTGVALDHYLMLLDEKHPDSGRYVEPDSRATLIFEKSLDSGIPIALISGRADNLEDLRRLIMNVINLRAQKIP